MKNIYIGALSGTSMDTLDAAAVQLSEQYPRPPTLVAFIKEAMPEKLRQRILALQKKGVTTVQQSMYEHKMLGRLFSQIISRMIRKNLASETIKAIGLHGQTLLHRPKSHPPFTLQIGDPHIVATRTKCTVVSNFRQPDIDNGGQGAPISPAFHHAFFATPGKTRMIVNIGGIANITRLESDGKYRGCDCGPGNILIDAWARKHLNKPYDRGGAWARSGVPNETLITRMLEDKFFKLTHPKSACATDFSLPWLERKTNTGKRISPEDIQSSLTELTARCIAGEILTGTPATAQVLVCGGGIHNTYLMERLHTLIKIPVNDTQMAGLDPDWVEAAGFAYLAQQRLDNNRIDLRATTGARKTILLGSIYRQSDASSLCYTSEKA